MSSWTGHLTCLRLKCLRTDVLRTATPTLLPSKGYHNECDQLKWFSENFQNHCDLLKVTPFLIKWKWQHLNNPSRVFQIMPPFMWKPFPGYSDPYNLSMFWTPLTLELVPPGQVLNPSFIASCLWASSSQLDCKPLTAGSGWHSFYILHPRTVPWPIDA